MAVSSNLVWGTAIWASSSFPRGVLPGDTLPELFEAGLSLGPHRPFLGHRPLLSSNPPTLAREYVWESYGSVDARRRRVGSALEFKYRQGSYPKAEFETVGIWSANRPGAVHSRSHATPLLTVSGEQSGK